MAASYGGLMKRVQGIVQHFNYNKYWTMREYVVTHRSIKAWWYLYRIKKMDAFNNASMGTHVTFRSAKFKSRPILPHGLNVIIIANDAVIGDNCTIYHQVTIGGGNGGSPKIGDNVSIGAGAKLVGAITIGNNVRIGAGCVVAVDVPDNATVVMLAPRVITKKSDEGNENSGTVQ